MPSAYPTTGSTPWNATLKAYIDSSFIRPSSSCDAFGHSYLSTGVSDGTYLWWQRFATMLTGTGTSYGLFGSRLIDDYAASKGGYNKVLQTMSPIANAGKSATSIASPTPGPFLAMWGYNDAADSTTGTGANIAAITTAYSHSFRTVVSFAQAGWRTDASDATVTTLAGTWSSTSSQNNNVNNLYKQTSTGGDTITIALPSGFLGGTVALRMICNKSGGSIPASTVTTKVDGTLTAPIGLGSSSISTQLTSTISPVQVPFRFNLSAGAHTILVTAGTGGMAFDGIHIESSPPRPVLWANIAKTPAMTGTQITSAAALNSAVASIAAAEFGTSVVRIVDIDTALGNNAANFYSDNVHPNDTGNSLMADAFLTTWQSFTFAAPNETAASGRMLPQYLQTWRTSAWHGAAGTRGSITPPSNGQMYYTPFVADAAHSFQAIGVNVTGAGNAGALIRLGVYSDDGFGAPNLLLYDFGTVAGDATGIQSIGSLTITVTGRAWLCTCFQSSGTTRPTVVSLSSPPGNVGLMSSTDFSQGGGWLDSRTFVAGSLPIGASANTAQAVPLVGLKA